MRKPRFVSSLVLVSGCSLAGICTGQEAILSDLIAGPAPRAEAPTPRLPLTFVANEGQWDTAARFVAREGGVTVRAEPDALVLELVGEDSTALIRLVFEGGNEAVEIVGEEPRPGRRNYFLGRDPERWRTGVSGFAAVRYVGLWDGIDLRVRERDGGGGGFEYDLLLEPGADPAAAVLRCEGATKMTIAPDGGLTLETSAGDLQQPIPVAWEVEEEGRVEAVDCRYRALGDRRFGFEVPDRNPARPLVVDPGLVWSSYLGGSVWDAAFCVDVDERGAVTVGGGTSSTDFPTTPGALKPTSTNDDAFVARFAPAGNQLQWATYFGGTGYEIGTALALRAQGDIVLVGWTNSSDLPVTVGAFDTTYNGSNGSYDLFVARISSAGDRLHWCTFVGGSSRDFHQGGLALDAAGNATISLRTESTDFPTTPGAYDRTHNGGVDMAVFRVSAQGDRLLWSTFLGGSRDEFALGGVVVDASGATIVGGGTYSGDFPTTPGSYSPTLRGGGDAVVVRIAPAGDRLLWSTFLGGTNYEQIEGVAIDENGAVVLFCGTNSSNFPTTVGAFDRTYNGGIDAAVAKLAPTGDRLIWSTYLGGSGDDISGSGSLRTAGLCLSSRGLVTVAGPTQSGNFPTTPGALQRSLGGGGLDAYVTQLTANGDRIVYSTYLGGAGRDFIHGAMAMDAEDRVVIVGSTDSAAFPTTPGSFSPAYNGGIEDGFVSVLDMLPTGARAYGASSPGCNGVLVIGVSTWPRRGEMGFVVTCSRAPANGGGALVAAMAARQTPLTILGADLWVDRFVAFGGVVPNAHGVAEMPLPIPLSATFGAQIHLQWIWNGPSAPPPCPASGLSASNAMEVTIH